MSDASPLKDARAIFQNGGATALKAAISNTVPVALPADSKRETPEPFPITLADLGGGIAEARDFVESLLTEGGASVIYGPSNCGKSFWILDRAVCVATGADFRDELEVDQGAVVYVALEGEFGVRNRIEALKQAERLPADAPLFLCDAPVSLLEPGHEAKLAESLKLAAKKSGLPCRLVILDTLARAMAGGDENRSQPKFLKRLFE
jgi:RecA-family ATPase